MKTFKEYKDEVFDKSNEAGEVGLMTNADYWAIQAMLTDLATELEELKKKI